MKGFIIISIAVVLGTLLVSAISMIVIAKYFEYKLWFTTKIHYESTSEDLALLSLLNSKCNGKLIYSIISNHKIFSISSSDMSCIKDKLKMATASDCFKLYIDEGDSKKVIVDSSNNCKLKKAVCYAFSKPYNPNDLTGLICLQVG